MKNRSVIVILCVVILILIGYIFTCKDCEEKKINDLYHFEFVEVMSPDLQSVIEDFIRRGQNTFVDSTSEIILIIQNRESELAVSLQYYTYDMLAADEDEMYIICKPILGKQIIYQPSDRTRVLFKSSKNMMMNYLMQHDTLTGRLFDEKIKRNELLNKNRTDGWIEKEVTTYTNDARWLDVRFDEHGKLIDSTYGHYDWI